MINDADLQLRAGMVMGELMKDGYAPPDVVALAVTLIAYIIETNSPDPAAALEATITALRLRVLIHRPS